MSSLSCVMPIVFVLYFFRQVPLKWAVSCKAGLGHVFNHSSSSGSGGLFVHQIHNDQGGKEGNERNVSVSIYWDHLDILLVFEEATSWPGHLIPPFLLPWCAGVLRVPALHLVAFRLMMWNYKRRGQKWRRRWRRGLPTCRVPVGAGASTASSLRRQTAMTLIVHHSTGTLALNDAQGLQLDQCISGFKRWARASLRRQHKPQRYEGLTAAVLGKALGEGCFGGSHPRHHVLGITAL